ncbi:MAG: hypothetical protein ACR2MG_02510 [Pyrinomonadaceae bacterium]
MLPCQKDNKSFFQILQNAADLDLRDKRGKKHDLAVVARWRNAGGFVSPRRLFIKHSSALEELL